MELTINTTAKIVLFKGRININDLINELADLGIDFKEWTIEGEPYTFTPSLPDPIPLTWPVYPIYPIYPPFKTTDLPIWTQEPTIWCNVCKI